MFHMFYNILTELSEMSEAPSLSKKNEANFDFLRDEKLT